MSAALLNFTQQYTVGYCCHEGCGIAMVIPAQLDREWRNNTARSFYCLNGHSQHYTGKSEAEKLKAQLEVKERALEWERARVKRAEKQVSVFKGKVTRIKNRVGNGVCPCCNRTFQNLMAHMKTQHPAYAKETE